MKKNRLSEYQDKKCRVTAAILIVVMILSTASSWAFGVNPLDREYYGEQVEAPETMRIITLIVKDEHHDTIHGGYTVKWYEKNSGKQIWEGNSISIDVDNYFCFKSLWNIWTVLFTCHSCRTEYNNISYLTRS